MEQEVSLLNVVFDNFLISRPVNGQTQLIVTDSFLLVSVFLTIGYIWVKGKFKKKKT